MKYKILDHVLKFENPYWEPNTPVYFLSPVNRAPSAWYSEFEDRILRSMESRTFFPVLRASDGEFRFLLGPQPPSSREILKDRVILYLKYLWAKLFERTAGFTGQTAPGISVGRYSVEELKLGREVFAEGLFFVLEHGQLAAHLQFSAKPFQECFHPAFKRFLDRNGATLTADNYVPFYFVYLYLSRVATAGLLKGRRVLFINGASEEKRQAIDARFEQYKVSETRWIGCSKDRSLFDRIEFSEADLQSDICILGGGVGKFNLVQQLGRFSGPIIDAGYYFEAWANPKIAKSRKLCIV